MIKNIINLGDAALYCDFGKKINKEINSKVINYFKNIKNSQISGITNIVPSYNLPKLHELIKDQLPPPKKGFIDEYKEIIPAILKQAKNPEYKIDVKLTNR